MAPRSILRTVFCIVPPLQPFLAKNKHKNLIFSATMGGPSSDSKTPQESSDALAQSLQDTSKKVEASLLEAIEDHINSTEFSPFSDGLDFLDTKNSMLLSYLIDLTVYLREQLSNKKPSLTGNNNWNRLTEMKTALDKLRGLDKKLRYQIDKLLAAGTSAKSFAAGSEDPLQFRPNADALETAGTNQSDSSGDDSEGEGGGDSDDGDNEDIDADLAAARLTMTMAKDRRKATEEEQANDDGVYRPPRLAAVPYAHDQVDKEIEKDKRQRRRMRASEVAQTLRSQYGEAPETEDAHGGSELGKQREAARRMAERDAERTRFEEETMIRMTDLRKDKKERNRLMRAETSNLAAIADLGNIVRDTDEFGDTDRRRGRHEKDPSMSERHSNGKRRREILDRDGKPMQQEGGGRKKNAHNKNDLQAALYAKSDTKSSKPKRGRR
jgi:hypothetical protein